MLRWELVGSARGIAPHLTAMVVALASAGLVGIGIVFLNLWSPFTQISPTFPGRVDPANAAGMTPIIGEFRGGVAFLVVLIWLLLLAGVLGPALTTGAIVRDRTTGRLDRILIDAGRAEVVALTKMIASLVPLSLILLTASPAASFAWLVGGLPTAEATASVGVVLASVLLIAAIGLFCAAVAATEVTALLTSSIVVGLVLFGPLAASIGLNALGFRPAASVVISSDPFVAVLTAQPEFAAKLVKLISTDFPIPQLTWSLGRWDVPVWVVDGVGYIAIAIALVWLTSVVIEPLHPIKTWRLRQARLVRKAT